MPNIKRDFYSYSVQLAITCVKGKSQCYWRKKIPEVKTVTQYSIFLEEAVSDLFKAKNDEYIVELLEDAEKNKKWPKKYQSYMTENCVIGNRRCKGKFYIRNGLRILLRFTYIKVTIYPDKVEVKNAKGAETNDINKCLNKQVMARILELQEVLKKLQEIHY